MIDRGRPPSARLGLQLSWSVKIGERARLIDAPSVSPENTCHSLELMRRFGEIAAIALCATEYGGRGFSAINYAGMRMTAVHYGFFPIEVRNSGCLLHSSQEPV